MFISEILCEGLRSMSVRCVLRLATGTRRAVGGGRSCRGCQPPGRRPAGAWRRPQTMMFFWQAPGCGSRCRPASRSGLALPACGPQRAAGANLRAATGCRCRPASRNCLPLLACRPQLAATAALRARTGCTAGPRDASRCRCGAANRNWLPLAASGPRLAAAAGLQTATDSHSHCRPRRPQLGAATAY